MASAFFLFSIKTILNLPCHSCYTSQIPGAEAIFNQIGSLCFINSMPQKLQHNETEQERSKMEGNIHNSHHFYCHVYLCVYFKTTWYLAEMLWSCALRETQWSNTLTDSDSTTGTQHHRWDRVSQNFLCFIATLRSSPQDRILC